MSEPLIIAIDGPSGVGKSTVARQLAKRLRLPVLDTGAMYRAVALKAQRSDCDPDDSEAVTGLLEGLDLEIKVDADGEAEVHLDGLAVGQVIRTPEITDASSRISRHEPLRSRMVEIQRRVGQRSGGVLEGRDIGTVVFPDTRYKFFLSARPQVRAERRHRELVAAGKGSTVAEVLEEIVRRDERDQQREASPLRSDESYFEIDTSDLKPPEIVERMVGVIRRKQAEEQLEIESAADQNGSGDSDTDSAGADPTGAAEAGHDGASVADREEATSGADLSAGDDSEANASGDSAPTSASTD